jgi:uncharacterized phage-associated protein
MLTSVGLSIMRVGGLSGIASRITVAVAALAGHQLAPKSGRTMESPYKAKSIANAFLSLANSHGADVTPMQLQKLIYFANGYFMAEHDGRPLVNEFFEAWDYGPVVPTVYYEFREYVDRPIRRLAYTFDRVKKRRIVAPQPVGDDEAEDTVKWVWDAYGGMDGPQLSRLSHKVDGPWDRARKRSSNSFMRNERLEQADLMEYFGKLVT